MPAASEGLVSRALRVGQEARRAVCGRVFGFNVSSPVLIFAAPDAKGLSNPSEVEVLREKVYASLETYCKQKYPEQQGR